jgi:hypothetical protein
MMCVVAAGAVAAQDTARATPQSAKRANGDASTRIEIYGFAMGDFIYDFMQNNADWFDVNRPTKLPAVDEEFGKDHRTWFSARQSRFGVKASIPTTRKPVTAVFEFDLFGVGVDAGQTTIRPRHMYGTWGKWGAGQTNSVFMDIDVFPNTLEYWGPNGMLFFRNVQVWYQPINKPSGTRATIEDRIELDNLRARFPAPDVSAEYRYGHKRWGYVEAAGIVRWIYWDDILFTDAFDLDGHDTGWGATISSNVNMNTSKRDVLRLQFTYGEGIQNYFNDAPVDIGPEFNIDDDGFIDPIRPIVGVALPIFGMTAYLDHRWNSKLTTAIGYSRVDIDNSDLQLPIAYQDGQYASVNLLWTPVPKILIGGELLYGDRRNFLDTFDANDVRFQFSMKYSFSQTFGGNGNEQIRAQD